MSEPEEMRNGYRAYTAEELEAVEAERRAAIRGQIHQYLDVNNELRQRIAEKVINDAFWIGPKEQKVKDPVDVFSGCLGNAANRIMGQRLTVEQGDKIVKMLDRVQAEVVARTIDDRVAREHGHIEYRNELVERFRAALCYVWDRWESTLSCMTKAQAEELFHFLGSKREEIRARCKELADEQSQAAPQTPASPSGPASTEARP